MEVFSLPTAINQGLRLFLKNSFIHCIDQSDSLSGSKKRSLSCPAAPHSACADVQSRTKSLTGTTAMVRNIPAKFTQAMFMKSVAESFDAAVIDFFYLPVDFGTRKSLGYCFINFNTNDSLNDFFDVFEGHQLSPNSPKLLAITSAKVQGFEKNYNLFRASSVMTLAPLEYRPMVRCPHCKVLHPLLSRAASSESIYTVCQSCSYGMSTRQRSAQSAFASRDSELSRAVHQSRELAEIAAGKSDFLHGTPPSSSFTSSSTSSILIGSVASSILSAVVSVGITSPSIVWSIGSISMSLILYLATWIDERMKSDFTEFEKSRERWEVENFPEGEIQEMIHIYTEYGISEKDAETVAKTLSKYPEFWIDHMLLHEIGILPPAVQRNNQSNRPSFRPFVAFISSFLVPFALILLELPLLATVASNCQVLIILFVKSASCQWLSTASSLGIAVATCMSCLIIHLISKTILSLV